MANLPEGEVDFVPTGAEGPRPRRYEDGTLGMLDVSGGRIQKATFRAGNPATIQAQNRLLGEDPATGELGELGFGTQQLSPSGRDIQEEKLPGRLHVATGRSDHLGGHWMPNQFKLAKNATHDGILFSPTKTPEILVPEARMFRDGKVEGVITHYPPAPNFQRALAS